MNKNYIIYEGNIIPFICGGSSTDTFSTASIDSGNSTDILFMQVALGEGPVYRINPNGIQDIEADDKFIDDLVDFNTNNARGEVFQYRSKTGTLSQGPMNPFGKETVSQVRFSSPIQLKSGFGVAGLPPANVLFQATHQTIGRTPIDSIRFKFIVNSLKVQLQDEALPGFLSLAALVYNRNETANLNNYIAGVGSYTVNSLVENGMNLDIEIKIPDSLKTEDGYRLSVLKVSADSNNSNFTEDISFIGFDEIQTEEYCYPRTAIIGYAIKATEFREGSAPTFTSLVKGLLCKVPSNYNQPILEDGQIDWRQIEVPISGSYSYTTCGYRLQATNTTVLTEANPEIYKGIWDGTFVYSWTQNPVWILYEILTNPTFKLTIPENFIDKFSFYKAAQYCDAVNPANGRWSGVNGYADGTFRYKPRNFNTDIASVLLGLDKGTAINERRFITDITIQSQDSAIQIINSIASAMRAELNYSGGKIRLNIDTPDQLPVMLFNETNIKKNSIALSGIREEELITAVNVSFINPSKHYIRDTVKVSDPKLVTLYNQKENIIDVEVVGCTRRSQAIRFAQYLLASNKYVRRRIQFTTLSSEASDIDIGEIISLSQKNTGVNWGFNGQIFSNSSVSTANVFLEHFTSPGITSSIITGNTYPLALRISKINTDRTDLYLLSNVNFSLTESGNAYSGVDIAKVTIIKRFDQISKTFVNATTFSSNNVPSKYDLWSLGEVNPTNIYSTTSDKLFKVESKNINNDFSVTLTGSEYISNVYVDSETLIDYSPIVYNESANPLVAPPTPDVKIISLPRRNNDGSIVYNLYVNTNTNTSGYPLPIKTQIEYSYSNSPQINITGISS